MFTYNEASWLCSVNQFKKAIQVSKFQSGRSKLKNNTVIQSKNILQIKTITYKLMDQNKQPRTLISLYTAKLKLDKLYLLHVINHR